MALHQPLSHSPDNHLSSGGADARELFGRYLLFKLLKRDALGETHRAGQVGSNAIERVVSLRLFNGAGIDGERFWQACQSRRELESTLRGGPFGEVVDSNYEGGVCYVAHEFVFGRSLAELLDQARETTCPVPIEHAIQIMDRVAMSLHNANDQRLEGKRVSHGFLVPAFVQLSSEGEVRLTGFESTGGILDLPANGAVRSQLAGYTSPEVNQGQSPTGADDIYSMASIFYELLTGEKLPPMTEGGAAQWVDAGILAEEAEPLSAEVRQLLHQSLAPRGQRIQDAEAWHRELGAIAAAGEYSPTTFNLAFFMHTLFGEELDREVRVVDAERQERVEPPPVAAPAPAPTESTEQTETTAAAAASATEPEVTDEPPSTPDAPQAMAAEPESEVIDLETEVETAFDETLLDSDGYAELAEAPDLLSEPILSNPGSATQARTQAAPEADSRRRLYAGVAVLAVAGILVLAVFVFDLPIPGMGGSPAAERITVTAAPRVADVGAGELAGPEADLLAGELADLSPPLSPEELESQVRSLVAKRAGNMEASLKAEYDQRLVELRRQLEDARQAEAAEGTSPEPVDDPVPIQPRPREPIAEAQSASPPIEATPLGLPEDDPAPNFREAASNMTSAAAEREPVATPPARPAALEPAAAEPEPEPVEPGSIVTQGAGVTAPTLVRQPSVVYPPAAVRLKREASVRVRLLVDEQGRPTEIEQIGPKIGMGFDQAALRAAKSTRWTPPTKDGVAVKMWVEFGIDFRP